MFKVCLSPENPGHLGDDTFWRWFAREFPNSVWGTDSAKEGDVVLRYSVLGPYVGPAKYIACCWELYPEMQRVLPVDYGNWDEKVRRCIECANGTPHRTVPTEATVKYYSDPVRVIPLTVDTDVFTPLPNKLFLRGKYDIPRNARVGFWSGTTHYMKGYDLVQEYARSNPDIYWILCWKQAYEAGHMDGAYNSISILQPQMNELMNCADFFLSTGRLNPLFLVEWEAMSAGLPMVNAPGVVREFNEGVSREKVFELGWDRHTAKNTWAEYIKEVAGG